MLEPDRARNTRLGRSLSRLFPTARVYCEHSAVDAARVLAERRLDLFIVALPAFDFDILTLLAVWADHRVGSPRVLVIASEGTRRLLAAMRALPMASVVDSRAFRAAAAEIVSRALDRGETSDAPPLDSLRCAPPRAPRVARATSARGRFGGGDRG